MKLQEFQMLQNKVSCYLALDNDLSDDGEVMDLLIPMNYSGYQKWLRAERARLEKLLPFVGEIHGKGKEKVQYEAVMKYKAEYANILSQDGGDIDVSMAMDYMSDNVIERRLFNGHRVPASSLQARYDVIEFAMQKRAKKVALFGEYIKARDHINKALQTTQDNAQFVSSCIMKLCIEKAVIGTLSWYQSEAYQAVASELFKRSPGVGKIVLADIAYEIYQKYSESNNSISCLLDAVKFGDRRAKKQIVKLMHTGNLLDRGLLDEDVLTIFAVAKQEIRSNRECNEAVMDYFVELYKDEGAWTDSKWSVVSTDTEFMLSLAEHALNSNSEVSENIYTMLQDAGEDVSFEYANLLVTKKDQQAIAQGMAMYHQLADEENSVEVQQILGEKYRDGDGVDVSTEKALKYFRMAASNGNMAACCDLAYMLSHLADAKYREEIADNVCKALQNFDSDMHEDAAMLGLEVANGYRNEGMYDKAYRLYDIVKAYEHQANYELGVLCYEGRGCVKNDHKALAFWQQAKEDNVIFDAYYQSCFEQIGGGLGNQDSGLDVEKALQEIGIPLIKAEEGFNMFMERDDVLPVPKKQKLGDLSFMFSNPTPEEQLLKQADNIYSSGNPEKAIPLYRKLKDSNVLAATRYKQLTEIFGVPSENGVKIR